MNVNTYQLIVDTYAIIRNFNVIILKQRYFLCYV